MSVSRSSQNLEYTIVDGEEGDIERSATEIVDDDLRLAALLVETVRDSSSRGLIDDTQNLKAGDSACVLRGLALSVIEVCTCI